MISENSVLNTRYRLDKKVGQGGFAQVFLATDLLLERRVALKVLNSELIEDSDFLERFGREAKAIATLDHPNILVIHDFGQAEGTAYLVTPFIDGGTLYDKMRQDKNIPPAVAARYLQQMASALDYAHRRNIVHRDIKPHNMLLRSEDNQLFLADFGIAKVLSSASSQSRTSAIGTISYMSPEQLAGNVGKATDIYALGCVLFQMLVGQVPFTGPTEQVIMGHINGQIPSVVARSNGRLAPAMQEVFNRALAKNPQDRYQTAKEMSQAFEAALSASGDGLTIPLQTDYTPQNANIKFAPTQINSPVNPIGYNQDFSQNRTVLPPPGVAFGPPPGSSTPPYLYGNQPGPNTPFANQPVPAIPTAYPAPGGAANPPGYPPQAAWNNGPVAPQPAKKGPNLLLIGVGGLLAAVLIIVAAVLILSSSSPKPDPTQVAAVITPTSQAAVTGQAAATTQTALQTTPVSNVSTVTPAASTAAANVTTAAATTPAPLTTAAATTEAPTTAPPTTAPPTTVAPSTAPPTTAKPTIAPSTSTGGAAVTVDKAAIDKAFQSLPGAASVYIILPDGQTIGSDADRAQPSASTIKLWIAASAYEEAKAGRLSLSESYTVKQADIANGTGILVNNVGKTYTYGQIINTMLTYSDNTAANLVINKLNGYDKINSYILRNQYGATKLQRKLGDTANPNNNFTSARDAATYMLHLSKGEIVDGNSSGLILNALRDRKNYNADQNFFSTRLTGYQKEGYLHISGTGTKVRNEIGLVPLLNSSNIVIAILDADMPDEGVAENSIASAVQVISQSVKRA